MSSSSSVIVALSDINGIWRGKRLRADQVGKVLTDGLRLPLSIATVDIWGRDIDGNELVFDSGDKDGIARPFAPVVDAPWTGGSFLPVWLFTEDGAPHPCDPRQALAQVVGRYHAKGWRPVVATELEFYLTPDQGAFRAEDTLAVDVLERLAPFFDAVYAACDAQGIPADSAISECGPGQFEVNLLHTDDPLAAADQAVLFKRIVRGCARAHGHRASFMAKPSGEAAGSGLHVHFSLLDEAGRNLFDEGEEGSDLMRHAVGGLCASMQAMTLIFAPHANSYRRIRPNAHAPTCVAWGYENRTAAIRIPGGPAKARRIEHRVAGADANPYLVLAAVLGGALDGIEQRITPPAPIDGNAHDQGPSLPLDWGRAIDAFAASDTPFHPQLQRLYADCKRQELARFLDTVSAFELTTYKDL